MVLEINEMLELPDFAPVFVAQALQRMVVAAEPSIVQVRNPSGPRDP